MTSDGTDDPVGQGPDAPLDPDIWSEDPVGPAGPTGPTGPGPRRPPRRSRSADDAANANANANVNARPPRRAGAVDQPPAAPPRRPRRRQEEEEDEYFDLPRESRIPRWIAALIVLAVVVGVIVGGSVWWYHNQVDPPGEPGEQVEVQIPEGSTTSDVGSILDEEGVISSATVFGFYVGGKDLTAVQAGSYTFQANSSFDDAIEVLNAGPGKPATAKTTKVSIPEGLTVSEIVARIHEQVPRFTVEELNAALDQGQVPTSLLPKGTTNYEGLLFPATYEVDDEETAVEILTEMAQEMETRVAGMDIDQAAADVSAKYGLQLTPYDLLTVASLVQEEAGSPEEAPKVATVISNRLAEGTPLGIDATTRYLAEIEGGEPDYESTSPYNTRKQAGLPPTPIAASGEYALDAALHPADGPWLYYVLTDPGVHSFTADYDEFLQFKDQCIQKDLGCG
ncbi:MAG: putative periplasmic solute-binding protein [Ilumatobacteraceae bacterium]|nr:putative periplasmic solute-binding protein [Ilumatobacteraceae bacterium]